MDELADWASNKSQQRGQSASSRFSVQSVSAIIALMVTLTICIIVFTNLFHRTEGFQIQIPDILSNALTTILGFYFGSQVASKVGGGTGAGSSGIPTASTTVPAAGATPDNAG